MQSLCLRLNRREEARLEAMMAWVRANLDESHIDLALFDQNIWDYLFAPNLSYAFSRDFVGEIPSPWD